MSYFFEMTTHNIYDHFEKRVVIELPDDCGTSELCDEFLNFLEACGHSRSNALRYFDEEAIGYFDEEENGV